MHTDAMGSRRPKVPSSEWTHVTWYHRRREFLKQAGLFGATATGWGGALVALSSRRRADPPNKPAAPPDDPAWRAVRKSRFGTREPLTPFESVTTYNNFYELGVGKADPALNADSLELRPWTVAITGEVHKPRTVDIDTLIRWFGLEERVYRMRCVEAWSMVIPWVGFPLAAFIRRAGVTSRAKFVELTTLHDPEQLPGQNRPVLPWPYVEALRIDEATHPLTLLAVGLYGAPLPAQNGAPLRLVVPWKYGFKGAKSIVRIRFTETRPKTTWNRVAPAEYGFYANVNPNVDHPRWSQAMERRIGTGKLIATQLFNGYADDVGSLYSNLNLVTHF